MLPNRVYLYVNPIDRHTVQQLAQLDALFGGYTPCTTVGDNTFVINRTEITSGSHVIQSQLNPDADSFQGTPPYPIFYDSESTRLV